MNTVLRRPLVAVWLGAGLGLLPSLALGYLLYWPGPNLMSSFGFYLGQDFVNFWTSGYLALTGRASEVYDFGAYMGAVKTLFTSSMRLINFSYPPHTLLFTWMLAELPYGAALVLWNVGGLALFLIVSLAGADRLKKIQFLPALVFSPIVVLVFSVGQASLILAALFVGGLRLVPRHPIAAGMILAVLTVKPQLGLLLPPALLLLDERRAFLSAVGTTIALIALSVALFGIEPWREYLDNTLRFQQMFLARMTGLTTTMMVTPYAGLWTLGLPASAAFVLHCAMAGCVVVAALGVVRSNVEFPLKVATLGVAAVIVTPYCLNYDLGVPIAAVAFWATRRDQAFPPSTVFAIGLLWFMPYVGMLLGVWRMPILPLCVLWLFGELIRVARPLRPCPLVPAPAVAG